MTPQLVSKNIHQCCVSSLFTCLSFLYSQTPSHIRQPITIHWQVALWLERASQYQCRWGRKSMCCYPVGMGLRFQLVQLRLSSQFQCRCWFQCSGGDDGSQGKDPYYLLQFDHVVESKVRTIFTLGDKPVPNPHGMAQPAVVWQKTTARERMTVEGVLRRY